MLAAVSGDGWLRLWNVKLVQLLVEVQVSQDSSLTAVCVDPAQTYLVISDSAGFMYTYSIAAWKGGKSIKHQVNCPCVCDMFFLLELDITVLQVRMHVCMYVCICVLSFDCARHHTTEHFV